MSKMIRRGKDCSIPVFFSISDLSPGLLSWDRANFILYFGLGYRIKFRFLATCEFARIVVLALFCLFFLFYAVCFHTPLLISLLEPEQTLFAATLKVCKSIWSELSVPGLQSASSWGLRCWESSTLILVLDQVFTCLETQTTDVLVRE